MATIELVEITSNEYFSGLPGSTVVYGSIRNSIDPSDVREGDPLYTCTLNEARGKPGGYRPGVWYKAVWKDVVKPAAWSYDSNSDTGVYIPPESQQGTLFDVEQQAGLF